MKTADEYAKRYNHIAGTISTDPMYDNSYFIYIDELREILTKHDQEIKDMIDETLDKWKYDGDYISSNDFKKALTELRSKL